MTEGNLIKFNNQWQGYRVFISKISNCPTFNYCMIYAFVFRCILILMVKDDQQKKLRNLLQKKSSPHSLPTSKLLCCIMQKILCKVDFTYNPFLVFFFLQESSLHLSSVCKLLQSRWFCQEYSHQDTVHGKRRCTFCC